MSFLWMLVSLLEYLVLDGSKCKEDASLMGEYSFFFFRCSMDCLIVPGVSIFNSNL